MNTTESVTVDIDLTKPIIGYCADCKRALSKGQYTHYPRIVRVSPTRNFTANVIICRARGPCARRQEQQRKEQA